MNRVQDIENAVKANQTADLLCADLQEMVKSKNALLSDMALMMLVSAVELRDRTNRIAASLYCC